jgi:hypothetical protein
MLVDLCCRAVLGLGACADTGLVCLSGLLVWFAITDIVRAGFFCSMLPLAVPSSLLVPP